MSWGNRLATSTRSVLSRNDAVARERARLGRGGWPPRQTLLGAAAMTHHLVTPRLSGPPGEGAAWERPRRARSPNTTAWIRFWSCLTSFREAVMIVVGVPECTADC